ncbi:flippase-like domain-containing protein, partial [Nanohaloarchaea archaeon]|nr:flippase-like domain-containing protein [Candidatus Nanohaloarchaea archaeon]
MNKIDLKKPLAFSFTTLVFVSMLYLSDFKSSIEALGQARHHLLAAGFVLANAPVLIYAKVWKNMLDISDVRLSYGSSLKVVLANTFVNNLTPFGNIGGEAAATLYLSELTGRKKSEIFSAVFSASIINFTPLIILGLIGGILLDYISPLQILKGLSIVILASLWIKYEPETGFSNLIPIRVKTFLSETTKGLSKLKDRKKEVLFLLFLTHIAALLLHLRISSIRPWSQTRT